MAIMTSSLKKCVSWKGDIKFGQQSMERKWCCGEDCF